jgi:hypothetical protein
MLQLNDGPGGYLRGADQGFHVLTFVKRLICRNPRDKRRQIVFKMGQAGNGEKP